MARITALSVYGTPGNVQSYSAKTEGSTIYSTPQSMKALTLQLGGGIGTTLSFSGNTLPVGIVVDEPAGPPSGNSGVVFRVDTSGNTYIYLWDASQSIWREH